MRRLAALLLACLLPMLASAQSFPSRAIRLVAATPPGGGIDVVSRILAARLQAQLGQPVVVENRPGASGAIGAEYVKGAAPDGHTLLSGFSAQMVMAPATQPNLGYDPLRDFEPVARVGLFPVVLVAHPALPAGSVAELVRHAKAHPGQLNAATGSAGFFFATEAFKRMTGTDLRDVPFTGSAQAVAAVAAGTVDLAFVDVPPAIGLLRSGRLKALGVTMAQRLGTLPEVPAIAEAVPGYELVLWIGVFAPAGTPKAVVERLQQEILRALAAPDLREKLNAAGVPPAPSTAQEFAEILRRDLALVRRLASPAK
jgi:tripartite-type tricarboxylate transporter receptor subunit TctC